MNEVVPPRAMAAISVTPERIALRAAGPEPVAIRIDGVVKAVVAPRDGRVEWAWPPDAFGVLLDAVSTRSGRSVLPAPVRIDGLRGVRWLRWERSGRLVQGQFVTVGEAAPVAGGPLAVTLVSGGVAFGSGFAWPGADAYGFAIALDRLPVGEDGVTLQARIGTLVAGPALLVPTAAFEHVGYLDAVTPWGVRGWAARRAGGEPVSVGLFLDGRRVAVARADALREDVAAARPGGGRCGFSFSVKRSAVPAAEVDVRVLPDGPGLAQGPMALPAAAFVGHFDGMDGVYAGGWVIDAAAPERAVAVEAVCDGVVVGRALADAARADVAAAGMPNGRCGFHFALTAPTAALLERLVWVRVAGTQHALDGSPARVAASPAVAAFLGRERRLPASVLARLRRALTHRTSTMTLSLVLPAHETRRDWLVAAIESVRAQWNGNWELITVDDGSRAPHVWAVLAAYAGRDARIRALRSPQNVGIARAVNFGIRAARGDYVAVLDHDDALEPDAVHHVLRAAQETGADLIYSDEVLTGPALDQLLELRARPAWSRDYYLSHPYLVHLVATRRSLLQAMGGWDETMPISADVDAVLRASERARVITHVPRVLYRWRTHDGSAGHRREGAVMAATAAALRAHLQRSGQGRAVVAPGFGFNQFRVEWPDDGGSVLAVVPTKDRVDLLRACLRSLLRTTRGEDVRVVVIDHESAEAATQRYLRSLAGRHAVMPYRGRFNYARMNNRAVRRFGRGVDYLLFLNNDVEAITPGWLRRLRSLAGRREVGAVGPMLLYGNGRVQHAGVLVGFGGGADHAMRFADPTTPEGARNPGYNDNLVSTRDYSAVTAACLLMRRDVFERVGGFDERFPVGYNDTDLCLRVREAGYSVLYDGQTQLRHHESATRATDRRLADPDGDDLRLRIRWPRYFGDGDPFYSPLLTQSGRDHQAGAQPPGRVVYRATQCRNVPAHADVAHA